MTERVRVFLDWQNVYMRARESFHPKGAPYVDGQVHPADLGLELAGRGEPGSDRVLESVHVYRGLPDQQFDEKGYAAARRQLTAWSRNKLVVVHTRTLRYPDDWPDTDEKPREKGIDVALAIDVVTGAADSSFDTGIVMSADQDLIPALEFVDRRSRTRGGPRVEVAAWRGNRGDRPRRISIGRNRPYCHWLSDEDYWGLQDLTDYRRPAAQSGDRRPSPGSWFR